MGQTVSRYAAADAVAMQAHPDSVINQGNIGGNILAYRQSIDGSLSSVYSYVQFDISDLKGGQVATAAFSYRGKTGDNDFVDAFQLDLYSLKAGFDPAALNWNNKPAQDKKLAASLLNTNSARKDFINQGAGLVDYINEEARKGTTTIGFLIRSSGKDSTTNMWIGGADNGNYAPILSYTITPEKSGYPVADAVVMQAYPDSIVDQSQIGGNILAYRENMDGTLQRVESYVQFDISHLAGQQLETAGLSYRGKTGDDDFVDQFGLELFSLKADFDAETLTWNNKPARDKKLATSTLNTSSARKAFVNEGTQFTDYINEEIRKGATTIGLLFRSAGKDSTTNMWIGGAANGNYGPILDYTIAPAGSQYPIADAVVMQVFPDSVIDQSNIGGNILAYRENMDGALQRVESYLQFDISHLRGQQLESVSISYRGKTGATDFADLFGLELFSLNAGFDAETLTWNNKPARGTKLAASVLNTDSGRKAFINAGSALVNYLNEEIRKGAQTVGFLLRSSEKDSTTNMWIGGAANGNYAPILDYAIAPAKSLYGLGDAVVLEMFPDSVVNQADIGGNILAYRTSVDGQLKRVQSYVQFDISGLTAEIESAGLSYRGRTGETDFADLFGLELYTLKSDFNADSLTWNNKPGNDKKAGTSLLNASSARKTFINEGTVLADYINEALRKGQTHIGIGIRSTGKDSTSNMWIGGVDNGNYGPVLDLSLPNLFTLENDTLKVIEDVFVSQVDPDTNFEIEDADMHVVKDETNMASKEIYLKFDISQSKAGIGAATLMLRGAQQNPPTQEENFYIQIFGTGSDQWSENTLTWNTRVEATTGALAAYNITESKYHEVSSKALTDYIEEALSSGRSHLTFVVRGRDETTFRAWISSYNWQPALLALDYSSQEKTVVEDNYVAEATPDDNFDGVTAMQVAKDEAGNNERQTFLKFDLANARSNIVTSTLILKADQERSATVLDEFFIEVYGIIDNSWEEETITWNNKPGGNETLLLAYNVDRSADHELSSPALTNFVKEAVGSKRGQVSFVIKGRDDTPGANVWISDKGWRPAKLFLDYRQIAAPPAFLTPEGDYIPEVTVELAAQTPGSSIYYTLDGSEPTDAALLYTGGILLTDTTTIRARAYAPGLTPSEIVEATYNVAPVGLPEFTPTPLVEYNDNVTVTISINPADAFIVYSDDGSDPLTPYPDGGILLTETTTLRARGVSADGSYFGPIVEAAYTIVNTVAGTGTGPGGVGAPDNTIAGQPENALWLKADGLENINDGEPVDSWPDLSGNANDAYNTYVEGGDNKIPNTGENQKPAPTYIADGLNGKPVLQFGLPDGSEQVNRSLIINDADNLDGGAGISVFIVFKRNQMYADFAAIFQKRNISGGNAAQSYVLEFNGGANPHQIQFVIERQLFLRNDSEFDDQQYYIVNAELQGDFAQAVFRKNGAIEKVASFNQIVPAVDAPVIVGGFQPMNIAEVILYKKGLNAAQNVIVHNYLATKYGLDIADGSNSLKLYNSTEFTDDLIGIGKTFYLDEKTEQEHRTASGGGLQIDTRSPLNVGDFVLAAHNGAEVTDAENWERYWNIEVSGIEPNVNLLFDFEALGLGAPGTVDNLKLFYHDGSEWVDLGLSPTADGNKVAFAVDAIQSGLYALGQVTSSKAIDHSEHLRVFPNPVSQDEIALQLENGVQGRVSVELYDHMGRLLSTEWTHKTGRVLQHRITLAGRPAGLYTVKLLVDGRYRAVKKVVKQ
jgi:hypothetical protein